MTAMKYGAYALVAVVFGVVLVGLLPGQLSNIAAPAPAMLQGAESSGGGATGGSTPSRSNVSGNASVTSPFDTSTNSTISTGSSTAATSGLKALSGGGEFVLRDSVVAEPYADLKYYGMMGIGVVVAFVVYLVARRISG